MKPEVLKVILVSAPLLASAPQLSYAYKKMDDLFALSPAELAEIPLTIATSGAARSSVQSAAVTTVITDKQIDSMGATQLHEILDTVPGIHASIQRVIGDYIYTMRGLPNGLGNQVLLMMDGVRYTLPYKGSHLTGMELPVEAIQRIEIIRGPGSALYGADAFAGVINIVTKKAGDLQGSELGGRVGDSDTQSIWLQHGQEYQDWKISASLQYSHNNADNDRLVKDDAQTLIDQAIGTQASLAPGVYQDQSERWNAHLNLKRKHWQFAFWGFQLVDQGLRAGLANVLDDAGTGDAHHFSYQLKYSTEDLFQDYQISLAASIVESEALVKHFIFPPGAIIPGGFSNNAMLNEKLGVFSTQMFFPDGAQSHLKISTLNPEFVADFLYTGVEDHRMSIKAGFRYETLTGEESRNYGPGVIDPNRLAPFPAVNIAGESVDVSQTPYAFLTDQHREIYSFAIQDEWNIAEQWHFTAGLRYDHYSDFGGTINPRFALVWRANQQLTSKLLFGQAFRAPSFMELYQQNSALFIGNPELQPEEISTLEWVFDYRPSDDFRSVLNVYYFYMENNISFELVDDALKIVNGAGYSGYGYELEWDWQLTQGWRFNGNYAWQNSRDHSRNRRIERVPEHKIYAALSWNFLPHWQIQTQLNWVGNRISDVDDRRDLEDYQAVDFTLLGRELWGHLNMTASVRNAFNSHGQEPALEISSSHLEIPGRSYYLEMSVIF